jgi:hypothetical protein
MQILYLGMNYMVEGLEAMYEAATSSEFTENKAKEIQHHDVGAITPICMLQVFMGWPWSG